jgi:hypothetical protein
MLELGIQAKSATKKLQNQGALYVKIHTEHQTQHISNNVAENRKIPL